MLLVRAACKKKHGCGSNAGNMFVKRGAHFVVKVAAARMPVTFGHLQTDVFNNMCSWLERRGHLYEQVAVARTPATFSLLHGPKRSHVVFAK